jgi:hypothetical protein
MCAAWQALPAIASQLGRAAGGDAWHVIFFGHVRDRFGNALITRLPVVSSQRVALRGGSEVRSPLARAMPCGTQRRSALQHCNRLDSRPARGSWTAMSPNPTR